MFIVSGALFLIELLLSYAAPHMSSSVLEFLSYLALAVAFLFLFLWEQADSLARIAFIVAAVGWAIIAIAAVASLGSVVLSLGAILALVGSVVAGIVVFVRHIFPRQSSIAFLIAMIIAAIVLLSDVRAFLPGILDTILLVIFGILLIVTGVLLPRRR